MRDLHVDDPYDSTDRILINFGTFRASEKKSKMTSSALQNLKDTVYASTILWINSNTRLRITL